jgi:alpha-ketoglutarate-dependent taurine dioxygenase
MYVKALSNYNGTVGCEVVDINFNDADEVYELGKIVARENIVFVDQKISTEQLYATMTSWGQPSRALIHNYVLEKKIEGRHWREILLHLGYINKEVGTKMNKAVSMVSFDKDEKQRPKGIFTNGELDWHSDQCALDDSPRVIGLQSISDSANSQTQFLCTHDAYESMSSSMQSMVKELVCRHKWVNNLMAPGLNKEHTLVLKYNMVPIDGMETKLYSESATGVPGIKFPSHSFDSFVGMSQEESIKVLNMLRNVIFQEKYVYTQNWKDGQIVFMDQEITLHKRPTDVKEGDKRTMARVITYMDKLAKYLSPGNTVRLNGVTYTHDEFAKIVDADRLKTFSDATVNA